MRATLTSTAAGLAVMAIGVFALVAMFGAGQGEELAPEPVVVAPAPTSTTTATVTTTTSTDPVVITVPAPTPDLAGVGDAVSRVLYGNGYATSTAPDELEGALPPAVLALLIEREVTLTIATQADGAESAEVSP
ncbi:MAG: hypothetical protein WBN24_08920 [Acidimicrobiia bacterium]